jgi:hypothetical protein
MTGRLHPAQLRAMQERVRRGRPTTEDRDGPDRWEWEPVDRLIDSVIKPLAAFRDLQRRAEADAEAEVAQKTLLAMLGEDSGREGRRALTLKLFGPPRTGRDSVQRKVYLWREVRRKTLVFMVGRLIQRLARSLTTE